ncbi:MAG TPA: ABC transporter ATP-binding protein [Armatimonadota bacterium]|jgi:ATP-binding cassette subfamily B protein
MRQPSDRRSDSEPGPAWFARLRVGPALALVRRSHPRGAAAGIAITLIQGLLPVLLLYTTRRVVDAVASAGMAVSRDAAFRQALIWIGAAAGCVLLSAVAGLAGALAREITGQAVTDSVLEAIHEKAMAMDYAFFEDPHAKDILHRAQSQAPYRPAGVVQSLGQIAQNAISLIGVGVLLLAFHWGLTVLLIAAAAPSLWIRFRHSERVFAWQRKQTAAERRSMYLSWLLTTDLHAKEVRAFGLGPYLGRQFSAIRSELRKERSRMAVDRSIAEAKAQVVSLVPLVGVLALIGYQAVGGALSVGAMVMFYQAFMRGQAGVHDLADGIARLYDDNLFLTSLDELMALEPAPRPAPGGAGATFAQALTLDGVGFRYPDSQRKVLTDIRLTIRPGEKVALVGHNGCGKTTLVKLLLRLYDPTEGEIRWDGVDSQHLDPDSVRRLVGVVFQDYGCYNTTASENIAYGDVRAEANRERIERAARLSGADAFLSSLPHGYDSMLGKWFDDGEQISIGQWQKVALARALMREAPIVLLDEPTSAMDPYAERAFFRRLLASASDRTIILISHRLATVKMVDRIVFMENGRITESGSHEELVRRDGGYARMFVALGESDA